MLDDRKTAILSAVVQEYIATAQPVGSSHIAEAPTIKVSSATVRNEMAHLEHEGYLVQPHTSAGRIPTDKGYRYFVDHLTTPGKLDRATTRQVGEFFSAAHGRLEEMLHQTSNLLAALTNNAGVVVGPRAEAVPVRRVQLVALSPTAATVVVVFANGTVENVTVDLVEGDDDLKLVRRGCPSVGALDGRVLGSDRRHRPDGRRCGRSAVRRRARGDSERPPAPNTSSPVAPRRSPTRSTPSRSSGRCSPPSSSSSSS